VPGQSQYGALFVLQVAWCDLAWSEKEDRMTKKRSMALVVMLLGVLVIIGAVLSAGSVAAQPEARDMAPAAQPWYDVVRVPVSADTVIDAWNMNRNYSRNWTLRMRANDGASAMYQVDLSPLDLPPNVVVGKAVLRLYVSSRSNPNPMEVRAFAITRPWAVEQTTWRMADSATSWQRAGCNGEEDRELTGTAPTTLDGEGSWVEIDVTTIVSRWHDGGLPNQGLILKSSKGSAADYTFISTEHSTSEWHPYLEVSLTTLPGSTPTATPQPAVLVDKVGPEGPLWVTQYEVVSYTITVQNNGVAPLTGVILTDTLPLGTEFIEASDDGVYDGEMQQSGAVIWSLGDLDILESRSVSLKLGIPTWVQEKGNVLNMARTNCTECAHVTEGYWEIFVSVPTNTPTLMPTATATATPEPTLPPPTSTATPDPTLPPPTATPTVEPMADTMYFVLITKGWQVHMPPMYMPLLLREGSLP
jgi:uncharacterized repeat protein (TIGR01451 family)